jgi:hypothetical protein
MLFEPTVFQILNFIESLRYFFLVFAKYNSQKQPKARNEFPIKPDNWI